jgi:hypothetical protein
MTDRTHPLKSICELNILSLKSLQQNWNDISNLWKDELRLRFKLEYMTECINAPRMFSMECERLAVMFDKAHREMDEAMRK